MDIGTLVVICFVFFIIGVFVGFWFAHWSDEYS